MLVGQQHELLVSGPTVAPGIRRATYYSSVAASALIIWDALLTLDNEVNYIWPGLGRTHVKWIYLFSRWFGLLNQIGNQIWQTVILAYSPVPVSTCNAFFIINAVTFQLLQLCLDVILILRIWAVYQRNSTYILIAVATVIFETAMMVLTQAVSTPESVVDGTCLVHYTPALSMCFGIGIMVSQSVLLCLTYRGKVRLQSAARRSRLVTIVIRDGVLVFGILIAIVPISFLYLLFDQVILNVFLPWMPVMPTILTARIILNMQMAGDPTEPTLELSTRLPTMPHQLSTMYELHTASEPSRDS